MTPTRQASRRVDREAQAQADASFDEAMENRGSWEVTVPEAAQRTGISTHMIRWYFRNEQLRGRRVGHREKGRLLIDVFDLVRLVKEKPATRTKRTGRAPDRIRKGSQP